MKGMQKIKHGSSFRGALDYCQDREKGSDRARGLLIGGNMAGSNSRELAKEFGALAKLRPDIQKPVWHQSLRLQEGERLDAARWATLADDYLDRLGFTEKNQRAYFLHDDAEGQHIHLIANRIDADGACNTGHHESMKSTPIIAQLEIDYGLRASPAPAQRKSVKPKKQELDKSIRTGTAPPRLLLAQFISDAVGDGCDALTFCERLGVAGVGVVPNVSPSTGKLNGFSFELQGIKFKGSQVGAALVDLEKKGFKYEQTKHSNALNSLRSRAGIGAGAERISYAVNATRPVPDHRKPAAPANNSQNHSFGVASQPEAVRATSPAVAPASKQREPANSGSPSRNPASVAVVGGGGGGGSRAGAGAGLASRLDADRRRAAADAEHKALGERFSQGEDLILRLKAEQAQATIEPAPELPAPKR